MGKFSAIRKLSRRQIDELFIDFASALAVVHNKLEAANVIRDLLSEQEAIMLARRLQAARLIDQGYTYDQIRRAMKVSNTTITKVHTWMNVYGEGFRTIIKRTRRKKPSTESVHNPYSLRNIKRKYPVYFWPQLLLEGVIHAAGKRERERLINVVRGIKDKTKLTKDIMRLLQSGKSYHTQ